jgi:hypothetical protein
LAEVYLEQHNARFAVAAAEEGTAFIPFVGELDNILCIEEERVASLDNTVRYEGRCLQIPPNRNRHHFAKSTIRVLEYWNGAIALFHGPREIARFHSDGTPNQGEGQERVCRVSPLRGEPVDGVDSFGAKRPEPAHPAHR